MNVMRFVDAVIPAACHLIWLSSWIIIAPFIISLLNLLAYGEWIYF